jgi:hypothetical protein
MGAALGLMALEVTPLDEIPGVNKAAGKLLSNVDLPSGAVKPPIVIGETMNRVQKYADEIGGHAYTPWKNDPFDFDLAMSRNERWIDDQMHDGRTIIDVGPDFTRRVPNGRGPSPFYEMERRHIREWDYDNYVKAFNRSGRTSVVPGLD